jgi:hypothetical protein
MPAGSVVYGIGNDWDTATSRTTCTGQSIKHQYLSSSGDTFWTQRVDSAAVGTVAVCDTAPTGDRYNLLGVVVAPASGTDTVAPTTPTAVTASDVSSATANLSWTASTDNVGVTGYDIHSGGTIVATSTTTDATVTGLNAATAYSFTVTAHDAAGNSSTASTPVGATTLDFPDATTTGVPAGTTLHVAGTTGYTSGTGWNWVDSAGWIRVTGDGAVIQNLDVPTQIYNPAGYSVTIEDSLIRGEDVGCGTPTVNLGAGSTLEDTTIGGGADGTTFEGGYGFYSSASTANSINVTRVNIGYEVHGMHIDGGTTVTDSYIHDMPRGDIDCGSRDNHSDGAFISTGHYISFSGNAFVASANNSSIFVQDASNTTEGVGDLSIDGNEFVEVDDYAYGTPPEQQSFGVGIQNEDITGPTSATNNVFSHGWTVGPIEGANDDPGSIETAVSGNTYTDGTSADDDAILRPIVTP